MNRLLLITFGFSTALLFVALYFNWFSFTLEESLIGPVFISFLTLFVSTLYLLIFNLTIQQSWWRWARFTLIIPIALIIILLPTYQNGGGFITFGGTTDLVILWGVMFGVATAVYTVYQRWYLKTGVVV